MNKQKYLTITEAAAIIPGQPAKSTVWKWLLYGVGGRRLESVKIGGRRFVPRDAIDRFIVYYGNESAKQSNGNTQQNV